MRALFLCFFIAAPVALVGVAFADPLAPTVAPHVATVVATEGADGAALFTASCAKCHGEDGRGKTKIGEKFRTDGKRMPDLVTSTMDRAEVLKVIVDGVPETPMKGYGTKLKPEEIEAIVDFTMKVRGK